MNPSLARFVRKPLWLIVVAGSTVFTGISAFAQIATPAAPAETDEKVIVMEKYTVTGSLIPMAADTPAIPITILTSVDIERSGVTGDILQILKKMEPYFYGANNIGADNGNIASAGTIGGSQAALRNRATLVLINGRRVNVSPVVAAAGGNFVDISMIPVAAVDRIEILTDGASATYGSDAVAGVINIILKSNYSGVEIAGRYGYSPNDGNYSERGYSAVIGASNDKTSVTISTEFKKSDPLLQGERPFGKGIFLSPTFAGVLNDPAGNFYYLSPSLNAPPRGLSLSAAGVVAAGIYSGPLSQDAVAQFFDLAAKPTMLIEAQRRSFVAMAEHRVNDSLRLFGDFLYTAARTESVLNAQPVASNVAAGNLNNPFNFTITVRNRFIDFPRIFQSEAIGTRGVIGAKGNLRGTWTYEVAGNFNRTVTKYIQNNLIDNVVYLAAISAGTYNPFARVQNPGVIKTFVGQSFRDFVSELNGFDLRLAGEVFDLPGGPLQMGFGAETRWEHLTFTNDRLDQTGGWLASTPRQPFSARSNTDGAYVEARVPVFGGSNARRGFHMLELSLAARKDIYSATTDPFVPKYTFRWAPLNDEFIFRGTYSESFSAPTLFALLGPIAAGFTGSINIARYDTAGVLMVNPATGTPPWTTGGRQYRSRSGSNKNLNPSESRNWTAGIVWSPKNIKGLNVTADWFEIDERALISTVSSGLIVSSLEQFGTASPYWSYVRLGVSAAGETYFDTGTRVTTPGQMSNRVSDSVWITNQLINIAGVWQQGLDVKVNYKWEPQSWGKLDMTLSGVYIHEFVVQSLPTSTPFDFAGSFSGSSALPSFRTYTRFNWSKENWSASLNHTFIPGMEDRGGPLPYYKIEKYSTFDLQAGYNFAASESKWLKGLAVNVGINNALNEMPPNTPSEGNQGNDINTYDPIGHFIWMSAKYKF